MSDEYQKQKAQLQQQINAHGYGGKTPAEIAAAYAHDQALSSLMAQQTERRQAERRAELEAEQRRKEEAEEKRREEAEDKHMEMRRELYLKSGGTASGWRSVREQVLQEYRASFLGDDRLAAKRASGIYDL